MNRQSLLRCLWACLVVSLLSQRVAIGDSWGPPQREHRSANQKWALILNVSGDKTLSLCEYTDDGLKEHWRRDYGDSVFPPHRAYVTNDGKYVVLRDKYHNLGHGKVIVILGEDGNVLGSYALENFLTLDEILEAKRSVSSIWWNDGAWFSFVEDDSQFALVTSSGTLRSFDLATGKLLDLTEAQRAKIAAPVRQKAEALVNSDQALERAYGITLLGGMELTAAIPTAKRLFHDKTPTGPAIRRGRPEVVTYAVQRAAARALTRLIGVEAIPIIEEELPKANWYMREQFLEILAQLDSNVFEIVQTPDSATLLEMWKRLATNSSDDIRYLTDQKSLAIVKSAAEDRMPALRSAATKELMRFDILTGRPYH